MIFLLSGLKKVPLWKWEPNPWQSVCRSSNWSIWGFNLKNSANSVYSNFLIRPGVLQGSRWFWRKQGWMYKAEWVACYRTGAVWFNNYLENAKKTNALLTDQPTNQATEESYAGDKIGNFNVKWAMMKNLKHDKSWATLRLLCIVYYLWCL